MTLDLFEEEGLPLLAPLLPRLPVGPLFNLQPLLLDVSLALLALLPELLVAPEAGVRGRDDAFHCNGGVVEQDAEGAEVELVGGVGDELGLFPDDLGGIVLEVLDGDLVDPGSCDFYDLLSFGIVDCAIYFTFSAFGD